MTSLATWHHKNMFSDLRTLNLYWCLILVFLLQKPMVFLKGKGFKLRGGSNQGTSHAWDLDRYVDLIWLTLSKQCFFWGILKLCYRASQRSVKFNYSCKFSFEILKKARKTPRGIWTKRLVSFLPSLLARPRVNNFILAEHHIPLFLSRLNYSANHITDICLYQNHIKLVKILKLKGLWICKRNNIYFCAGTIFNTCRVN